MSYVHANETAQEMRSPDTVMRLARLGSAFPTRLSFGRSLIRRLIEDRSTVERRLWSIDERGFGRAVYLVEVYVDDESKGYFVLGAFVHPTALNNAIGRLFAPCARAHA